MPRRTWKTVPDRDGRFLIQELPPGDYVVRAEFSGLPPIEQTAVRVAVDHSRTLELRMLPHFREEVEVAGAPPILDATSSATSTIVERKEYFSPKSAGDFFRSAVAATQYPAPQIRWHSRCVIIFTERGT